MALARLPQTHQDRKYNVVQSRVSSDPSLRESRAMVSFGNVVHQHRNISEAPDLSQRYRTFQDAQCQIDVFDEAYSMDRKRGGDFSADEGGGWLLVERDL